MILTPFAWLWRILSENNMINYLSEFTKKPVFEKIEGLLPVSMCPFLFYNLTPYIFTLSNDGWFGWTKKCSATTYRKKITATDFKRKDVNRQYPNEVLVRCPNPGTAVVAGIGPWPEGMIKLRVLHAEGVCPNGHKVGEEIVLDGPAYKTRSLTFNALFPEILIQSLTGRVPKNTMTDCRRGAGATASISRIIFPCRYHKRQNDFRPESHLQGGFCPHVFGRIYPHVLALMYDAWIENEITIKHPGQGGKVTLVLHKVHRLNSELLRRVLRLIQKSFEAMFHTVDLLDYHLEITVKRNEAVRCSLEQGKTYRVNMGSEQFLCPASFHALYPYFMLCAAGGHMKWGGNAPDDSLPCPDCVGAVYSIH